MALYKLDAKWAGRWTSLQNEVSILKGGQNRNLTATENLEKLTATRLDTVEANQREILRAQDDHKTAIRAMQLSVISEIEETLTGPSQNNMQGKSTGGTKQADRGQGLTHRKQPNPRELTRNLHSLSPSMNPWPEE